MKCTLCHVEKPLLKSHIVPEFLHKPIYDQKHRFSMVQHGSSRHEVLQKGIRQRLLCEDCEKRFQKHEHYFAGLWYETPAIPERLESDQFDLEDLDYRALKLFLLSIVWRSSVSTLATYQHSNLGPHEDRMRRMLLNGTPGLENEYPIYAGLIIDRETRAPWDNVMLAPLRIRIDGRWAYRLVFAAASWTVIVSDHGTPPIQDHWLKSSGRLRLTCTDWKEFAKMSGLVWAIQKLHV